MTEAVHPHQIRVLAVGESSVGKTQLLHAYSDKKRGELNIPTRGIDFMSKDVKGAHRPIRFQLWDTQGNFERRFQNIINPYFRGVKFIFLIYDSENENSLKNLTNRINWINENADEGAIKALILNKKNGNGESKENEAYAESLAKENRMNRYECDAKKEEEVVAVFEKITKEHYDSIRPPVK